MAIQGGSAEPLIEVGGYTFVTALTNLLTVEGLLFASFSLAVSLSGPTRWGIRRWFLGVEGKHIAGTAVSVLALVAVGAGCAWWRIFVSAGFPTSVDGATIAIAIAVAIIAQPVLALFLAMGLRD